MAAHPDAQTVGHHSVCWGLRLGSHLRNNNNLQTIPLHLLMCLMKSFSCLPISVSRLVSELTVALFGEEVVTDVDCMSSEPSLDWLTLRRPASMFSVAPSVGWDNCFWGRGRPSTALPTNHREERIVSKFQKLYKEHCISGLFISCQSPGADSMRLGRRWGPRILGNLGFFTFSSPSFSVLMLFCKLQKNKASSR